jgi:hypothetical protein
MTGDAGGLPGRAITVAMTTLEGKRVPYFETLVRKNMKILPRTLR